MALNIKQILADALIELCDEMPLRSISVTMISKRAGTGRQTFYNHFRDKNDLIYWIFKRTLSNERELMEQGGLTAYLTNLYTEAVKYKHFLREGCLQVGQNSLSEEICNRNYKYHKKYILDHYGSDVITDEVDYALLFNAHGATSLYVKWVAEGMPEPPEVIANYAVECMPAVIRGFFPN